MRRQRYRSQSSSSPSIQSRGHSGCRSKKDCRRITTLLVKLFVNIVLLVDGLDVRNARYLAEARDNKALGRVRYLLELLGTLLENNSGVIKGLDISQIVEQLVQLVGVRLNLIGEHGTSGMFLRVRLVLATAVVRVSLVAPSNG